MKRHRHDEETMEATAAHGLTRTRNLSVLESAHGSLVSMDVNASGFWAKKTWDWAAFTPAADGLVVFSLTPSEDPESGSHVKWMQSKHLKMKRLATGSQTFFWWSLTPFWSLGQNLILLVITASITSSRRVSQCVHVGVTVYTRGSPSSFICINTPWFSLTNCSLWIILTRLCVCTGFTVLSKQDQVARGHSWLKTRKGKETHIKHTFLRQLGLFYELLNGAHGWRMCSTSYLVRSS